MYSHLWIVSLFAIIGLVVYFLWKSFESSKKLFSYILLGLFLLLFIWARIPFIMVDFPLNVDEAQYLAQALMFVHDPVPWLDVDPTGPLDSWVLLVRICWIDSWIRIVTDRWNHFAMGFRSIRLSDVNTVPFGLMVIGDRFDAGVVLVFWVFK